MAATLCGCQATPPLVTNSEANSSEDAVNVYVSALPPVPWSAINAKLGPGNNLTIANAQAMAANTTQIQVAQFLSSFAAGLSIGLPTATETLTTTIPATGPQTTSGTRVQNYGTVPSAPSDSGALPSSAPVPGLSTAPPMTAIDGSTLLAAGTALYQQAQILDNQIATQVLPDGYQVNLVTLQIDLQPIRRDLNYDTYTNIEFMPSDWREAKGSSTGERGVNGSTKGLPPVIVYPLVIMDAMETANVGHTIQTLRQAGLQLAGMIHAIGVNGQVGGSSDSANSIVGLDKNSLITLGRLNDDTVRVRIGAENSGSSGLALVPRSYNVSLVVLTRWPQKVDLASMSRVTQLAAVSHTEVYTPQGEQLQSVRKRDALAQRVKTLLANFGYCTAKRPCNLDGVSTILNTDESCPTNPKGLEIGGYLDLLRAVDREDYEMIDSELNIRKERDSDLNGDAIDYKNTILSLQRLVAELSEIQANSRYATLQIPLPHPFDPTLPGVGQLALVGDDKKQATKVSLYGATGIVDQRRVSANLLVQAVPSSDSKGASTSSAPPLAIDSRLQATQVIVSPDGREIDLTFPSLAAAELAPASGKPLSVDLLTPEGGMWETRAYAVRLTQVTPTPDPPLPIAATTNVITADVTGTGIVTLLVDKPDPSIKVKGKLIIVVSGADIRIDSTVPNSPAASMVTGKGILMPATIGPLAIKLGDLNSATPVTLTLEDVPPTPATPTPAPTPSATSNSPKPIGKAITLTVVQAPPQVM